MQSLLSAEPRVILQPRDYQAKDVNESFRLWDAGMPGVLTRLATGLGKTACACLKIRQWLQRGPDYRAMIISYEKQLVWQFADEVRDFLGIEPGIEMGEDAVSADDIPLVIVASRASLLCAKRPQPSQLDRLQQFGISLEDVGAANQTVCARLLKQIELGLDPEQARFQLERVNGSSMASDVGWSRLHKFDWKFHWLTIWDEAHRHAWKLKSVGHIADWFDRNDKSRRNGLTATPKRGDAVSIGYKMFPGVAIDFPLWHAERPCAVKEGWAVPYLQKYIEVEGVDFRHLKQVAGDFDDADLERVLGKETTLAKLCEPLLELVGDRRTLIFSPGVEMANDVAAYINARAKCLCPQCGKTRWQPRKLLGDGAECFCGFLFAKEHASDFEDQARSISGSTSPKDRKAVYAGHQGGRFQFLSVCGLCREGYNDPDIGCVAIFRPVSKAASSLAEQMKGRGCRPPRALIGALGEMFDADERVAAIAAGPKPDCLIVDLVGVTGLADCASTVQIYSEGLPDDVTELAEQMLVEEASEEEVNVQDIIQRAKEQVEAVKAAKEAEELRRRQEAEMRAKAAAEVKYSQSEIGYGSNVNPNGPTDGQLRYIKQLGMSVRGISRRQAGRIIEQLQNRVDPGEVAYQNGLAADEWGRCGPSDKQLWKLGSLGINSSRASTGKDASELIDAKLHPQDYREKKLLQIAGCATNAGLTALGKDLAIVRDLLPQAIFSELSAAGRSKRDALVGE